MLGSPFGPGYVGPPGLAPAYVGALSQPFGAQVADRETSPIARPYLDAWGSEGYVFSKQASGMTVVPPGGKNVAARIAINGFALHALTTPIPYVGFVPPDPFNDIRGFPYGYFCYTPYSSSPTWTRPAPIPASAGCWKRCRQVLPPPQSKEISTSVASRFTRANSFSALDGRKLSPASAPGTHTARRV